MVSVDEHAMWKAISIVRRALPARRTCLFSLLIGAVSAISATQAAPVRTDAGRVEGVVQESVRVSKGIPFAAAPVGELRWRAPRPATPWSGVRPAIAFAPACPQVQTDNAARGFPVLPTSEDCLYLNVWSPASAPAKLLPVMVWVYGGGFMGGATSFPGYGGEALAKKGVVVVSVAYRLGALGFLAHKDLSAESPARGSGTYGLMDLIAGLQWVKRNIAAFGGDPNRVTIFGESAGATAVSMLAASPRAAGLFHRAISESGGAFGAPRVGEEGGQTTPTLATAEKRGAALLAKLGVTSIAEARKLAADTIVQSAGSEPNVYWPVLDGDVLPDDPYKLYEAGKYNNVPVLAGINSDEGTLFVPATNAQQHEASVRAGYGRFADEILAAYPAGSDTQALRSARDLFSDTIFGWPTWTWARLQSSTGGTKVFLYYFARVAPRADGRAAGTGGALHGSEIAYVFQKPAPSWTAADRALSDTISSYWVNFARAGDPNGPGLQAWPAYRANARLLLKLDIEPEIVPLPDPQRMAVLDKYYAGRRADLSR